MPIVPTEYHTGFAKQSIEKTKYFHLSENQFQYTFQNFFHPLVGELLSQLNRASLAGMLDATWQDNQEQLFFDALYGPTQDALVKVASFPKQFDVSEHGPYANYNWELFFHIPLTVAVHLTKTQRFAEAQRWFHYIFDPTSYEQGLPAAKRFWKFLAFRKDGDPKQIDALLALLSRQPSELSDADALVRQDVLDGYSAILEKPFRPHAVARTRHLAYQYSAVMKYLDLLIAWGDNLFQQDTVETILEATQRYVLAANLLGRRPERVPVHGTVRPQTFAQLKARPHDALGNALVELEGQFPFNLDPLPPAGSGASPSSTSLFGIGRTFYFCIPPNDKLLGYWDVVADRLFKIRHCMNIAGVVRPLALFDPPIDPGMLVKAAAAGIDIGSIVNGLNQPASPVRCSTLIQKTLELCSEVRSLGGALLSAFEKGDAEHLSLVRQRHDVQIQQLTQDVRFLQWQSAQEQTKSLLTSRATALERLGYYRRLLNVPPDPNAPAELSLDRRDLTEENFDDAFAALVGQYTKPLALQPYPAPKVSGSTSPAQQSGASGQGRLYLNTNEDADLNQFGPAARQSRLDSMTTDRITGILALIPDMGIDLHFWGLGGHANIFGGSLLAGAGRFISSLQSTEATTNEGQGANATKTATFERRADDWLLQYNLAAHELMQNGRQILTSLIAEQIAHHEYLNTQQQIANSTEIDQLLHEKFSNEELYLWMQGELSRLYYDYYRFAFETARRTERVLKQELMRPDLDSQTFVNFNYWDGGRKGLLSGEALHLDVKRMELAYLDNNKRELELTRHISLRQLDPVALLSLKSTGTCTFSVPEWLLDRDSPGLYMRRIKSVALSLPSVVGPYTTVNCSLTLLGSSVRTSALLKDGEYARQGSEDDRFVDYAGGTQSIVTSGASNDSGLFETNLRDDRYLWFEGSGAVSTWKLELPHDYPAFDYATIVDAILHLRYTARSGVEVAKVNQALADQFDQAVGANLGLIFSLRHDFPDAWSAFAGGGNDLAVTIGRELFPYFAQGKTITITEFQLYGSDASKHHVTGDPSAATAALQADGKLAFSASPDAPGPSQVLTRTTTSDVYLLARYTFA